MACEERRKMSQSSQPLMLADHMYFVIVGDKFQPKLPQEPVVLVFYYWLYSEYRLLIYVLRIRLLGLADCPSYSAKVKIQSLVWTVWMWSRGSCLPGNNLFRSSHGSLFLTQSAFPISPIGTTCYAPNKVSAAQVVHRTASSHELKVHINGIWFSEYYNKSYNKKLFLFTLCLLMWIQAIAKWEEGLWLKWVCLL